MTTADDEYRLALAIYDACAPWFDARAREGGGDHDIVRTTCIHRILRVLKDEKFLPPAPKPSLFS